MSLDRTDTSSLDAASLHPTGARLLVEESGRPPRVVSLRPGGSVRVGRSDEIEVPLDDVRASRVHAAFSYDGRVVTVRDLESSNGTFVGDRRLAESTPVQPGDVVRVGSTRIIVVQPELAEAPTAIGPAGAAKNAPRSVPPAHDVIAVDPATVQLFALVRRLAGSDLPVLVQGETGSGKEVVARALHRFSPRAGKPFIAVNCATLPETIAESELFGHEKGSFTGAVARKAGVFEAAHGGTLFLDEAGELSAANQARLLRALQERVIVRVGATQPVSVDVRVVAATNRDLASDVARGRFREDLYFRLNGVTVAVPSLRSRPRDVMPLAERILAESTRGRVLRMSPAFTALLQSYRWPGNVRELRNAIECAVALADDDELRPEHLPPALRARPSMPAALVAEAQAQSESSVDNEALAVSAQATLRTRVDDVERVAIVAALDAAGWNQSKAARDLGISRRALIYKMERYGLKPRPSRDESE